MDAKLTALDGVLGCRVADLPPSLPHPNQTRTTGCALQHQPFNSPVGAARCLGGDRQGLFVCGQDVVVDAGNRALVPDLGVPCSRAYLLPRSHHAEGWGRRSIDADSGRESHHLHVYHAWSAGGDDEPDIRARAARHVECPGTDDRMIRQRGLRESRGGAQTRDGADDRSDESSHDMISWFDFHHIAVSSRS